MAQHLEHIDSYDYGALGIATSDLSVDRAVSFMPSRYQEDFRMVYEWFITHAGESGKKLTSNDLPFQNPDFKPSATLGRGIHVPAVLPKGKKYALTITSR